MTCPGYHDRMIDNGPDHGPASYSPGERIVRFQCNCGECRANRVMALRRREKSRQPLLGERLLELGNKRAV